MLARLHPGRIVGLLALAGVIVLGAALIATATSAGRTEAALRARIAELTRVNARQAIYWQARLQACEAAGPGQGGDGLAHASAEDRARRLAAAQPAGFDVCARMESADQAVLQTLK